MSDNLDIEKWKKTKFYKGWTRFNCLNKGYVIPEWAMEGLSDSHRKYCEKHNRSVREWQHTDSQKEKD